MFHRLNKKAQTTAEYAILIAIVVGALVGMQIYVRRGLQGRIRNVVDQGATLSTAGAGGASGYTATVNFTGEQFEPYYLATGQIDQTTSGSSSRTGSSDTDIISGESAYQTSRSGSRTSAQGLAIPAP
jgi:hypothetical protein